MHLLSGKYQSGSPPQAISEAGKLSRKICTSARGERTTTQEQDSLGHTFKRLLRNLTFLYNFVPKYVKQKVLWLTGEIECENRRFSLIYLEEFIYYVAIFHRWLSMYYLSNLMSFIRTREIYLFCIDLSDGQFSERCDVDGSFFNSDAIPIIYGKA